MYKIFDVVGLQDKLLEFTPEIKYNDLFLLNSIEQVKKLLNKVDLGNYTMIIYLNKTKINKLLYDEDKIIPIFIECMNKDCLKSMFYLVLAIKSEKFIINYSYESALIKKLNQRIKEEKGSLKKFMSFILLDEMIDNYQEFNNTEESFSGDELNKTSEEVKNNIMESINQIQKELNLNLISEAEEEEKEISKIERIYIRIITFLIKNKKFDNYEYSKDIMEQLDLENIELTNKIYEAMKKLFDEKNKEDYIDDYKINKYDNLVNEKIVNFYFILLRYIFKNNIYIYNINFLLNTKRSLSDILRKNEPKILEIMSLKEEKESLNYKIKFILKRFLDSDYYFTKDDFYMLKEVLKYFKNFHFQSKAKEIKEIEKIILNKDKESRNKYKNEYTKAKEQNKRFHILKFISDSKKLKFTEKDFSKNIVDYWEVHEVFIREKKSNIMKLKFRKEIFNYFNDEKNRDDILRIFTQDQIDFFIKNYNLMLNLVIIKTYYQNYYFESKKEEIELLPQVKDDLNLYLKELELAKKLNALYGFISKVFKIDKNTKTEKEVHSKLKEWENIERMLQEENFDIKDDNIKIGLFIYFNNEKNIESRDKILNEKNYEFLMKQRKEVEDVILNYYQIFYPESKKNEIESIKKGIIKDEEIMEYSIAKNINLRKPIIFSLLDKESYNDEKEIKIAKEKWEQMEKDINNGNFINININDKEKIINFFKNKENEENKFINQIFSDIIIDDFLNFKEEKLFLKKNCSFKLDKKKKNKKKTDDNKEPEEKIFIPNLERKNSELSTQVISVPMSKKDENIKSDKSDKTNRKSFYINNIFKKPLDILLTLEKKEIKIHGIIMDKKIRMEIEDFKSCEDYFSKRNNSKENNIFKFLDTFKQKLIEDFENNFKLILGLVIEKNQKEKNYSCLFKFIPPNYPSDKIQIFKECKINIDDSLTHGYLNLKKAINNEKYQQKERNNLLIKRSSLEGHLNNPQNNAPDLDKGNDETFAKKTKKFYEAEANKFQILLFIKIMGDHYEKDKMYTAEFIKELKKINCYISGGTDKKFIMYSNEFQLQKTVDEIKDWIYSVCESRKDSFIFCSNKQLYSLTLQDNDLKFSKYELPNMTCISAIEMETSVIIEKKEKETEKAKKTNSKKNKNKKSKQKEENLIYEEKTIKNLIIAGRNGIICFEDMFQDDSNSNPESKYHNLISDKTYRGLIQINEDHLAFTSNAVLPGGEDKLIIYNLPKNAIKEYIDGYSYIASSNGMAVIDKDNKKFLLCACKKYLSKQNNGILLVIYSTDENRASKTKFEQTKDFEVYCFCPIRILGLDDTHDVNDENDFLLPTDFFFVGGFDKKTREGKIKLYKLEIDNKNNDTDIKFLQDIEIDKIEERLERTEIPSKVRRKFNGFKGAISSIIQSSSRQNILVSCYDGKIYLLSKPNLKAYGVNSN